MRMVSEQNLPPIEVLDAAAMAVMKKYSDIDPHTDGYWMVYGEDQSGSYVTSRCPLLGVIKGEFHRVVALAVRAEYFYYWTKIGGSNGGEITKVEVNVV